MAKDKPERESEKTVEALFKFPELPDSQYAGEGYRGYVKRFLADFLQKPISWENIPKHLEENLEYLENLLIERSQTSGPPGKLENEIIRLNTVIVGYFSKIRLPDYLTREVQSSRVNPIRAVQWLKKFFRLKTMYEPLYGVPAIESPDKYSKRFKGLIQRYLVMKERFGSGAYILRA